MLEREDETIVGWALVAPMSGYTPRSAVLPTNCFESVGLSVFVHERYRRQGRGLRLVQLATSLAKSEFPNRRIAVGPVDEAGVRLFRRVGLLT